MSRLVSRRQACQTLGVAAAALGLASLATAWGKPGRRRYKIGACDWSIGKANDPASFALAREIGLDGLQINLGSTADDLRLRQPAVQKLYLEAAHKTGIEIASLAIAELNNVPYKSDERTVRWVSDSVDACRALGAKVVLLAFFVKGDLVGDEPGIAEVVRRLKTVAPKAEKAGVVLGIESWLSTEKHLEIIDRVGSPAVKVYYDVCNSNDRGYDIYTDIRRLGKSRICEFHAKENGCLLGEGKVDFKRMREALEDIDYEGWIQIEGAIPKGKTVLESYQANSKYLRQVLGLTA